MEDAAFGDAEECPFGLALVAEVPSAVDGPPCAGARSMSGEQWGWRLMAWRPSQGRQGGRAWSRRSLRVLGAAAVGALVICALAATTSSGWTAAGLRSLSRGRRARPPADGAVSLAVGDNPTIDGIACFIDSYQAVLRLANAATSIRQAARVCEVQENDNQMARCSAAANSALYNTIFIMGSIAQGVTDCAGSVNAPAVCIAAYSGFIANLDVIAGVASSATQTCNLWWEGQKIPNNGVTTTRRTTSTRPHPTWRPHPTKPPKFEWPALPFPTAAPLEMLDTPSNNAKADYQTSMVKCWVSTSQGAMFLMRAALILRDSTSWCSPESVAEKGEKSQRKCAVDVIGLLGSLALAARFISLAVPGCVGLGFVGDGPINEAACAADAIGVAAGLFAALAPGLQLKDACAQKKKKDKDFSPMFFDFPDSRRLAQAADDEYLLALASGLNESALSAAMASSGEPW